MELVAKLKETLFSIVIDETTDIQTKSELAIMVSYWCPKDLCIVVELLDFVECLDGTANGLSAAILDSLDKLGIPRQR